MTQNTTQCRPLSLRSLEQTRHLIALIRKDMVQSFDERLEDARRIRQGLQEAIVVLREELRTEENVYPDHPTVNDEGILGAVAWLEESAQVPFERTLRLADEILDEKDAEISRMRAQLEALQASENSRPPREFTSEEIAEERARLQQLQEEWREKMRHAEVEFSLERAKLTREHEHLKEKLCRLESELERANPKSKDSGRKWLRQLGLSETHLD